MHMYMHSTSADNLSLFFFLIGATVLDGKIELGGQIGGFEEILAVTSSPAFPDTIQTRDTENVC